MTLVRLRRAAQLTLPAEVRRALKVKDGDYLEAKITKSGSVLLKPVSIVEREKSWRRLMRAVGQVKDLQPNPNEDNRAEEEAIAEDVKALRRKHA